MHDARDSRPADSRRRVILLVEDNPSDRDVYGGLLWYNGYEVIHEEDGESAIVRAAELEPALVLLDLVLSGEMSGIDVCRRLRAEGSTVPVMILSAVPEAEVAEELEDLDVTAYLEKPIDPFRVVRAVQKEIGFPAPEPNGTN